MQLESTDQPDKFLNLFFEIYKIIFTTNKTLKKKYLSGELQELMGKESGLLVDFYDELKHIAVDDNHPEIENELAKFGRIVIHFFNKALSMIRILE